MHRRDNKNNFFNTKNILIYVAIWQQPAEKGKKFGNLTFILRDFNKLLLLFRLVMSNYDAKKFQNVKKNKAMKQ